MGLKDLLSKIFIFILGALGIVVALAVIGGMAYIMIGFNFNSIMEVFGGNSISTLMYVLFGFLALILLVSILGVVGVCCKSKLALALYTLFIVISLLGVFSLAAMIILKGAYLSTEAETQLYDSLRYKYDGDFSKNADSIGWNVIQFQFKTCGVLSSDDWTNSLWHNDTSPSINGITQTFPISCCKITQDRYSLTDIVNGNWDSTKFTEADAADCYGAFADGTAATNPQGPYTDGSKSKLISLMETSTYIVGGVAIGIVLLQLALVCAGCQLVRSDDFKSD